MENCERRSRSVTPTRTSAATACPCVRMHAIAFDGIRRSRIGRFESLLMAPGQRADVLVQAGASGTYALRAIANDQGYASPVGPLARIIVDGEPLRMRLPAALGGAPFATIRDEEVTNTRRVTL